MAKTKLVPAPDLRAINPNRDGSPSTVVVIRAGTSTGQEWIEQNVESEGWQWLGDGLVLDARPGAEALAGARRDGLTVAFGERERGVEEFHPKGKVRPGKGYSVSGR